MPLYEYKCRNCGDTFEVIQKFSDEPLTIHTQCGGMVERLVSASALQFKGKGWYVTDYAKSNGDGAKDSKPGGEAGTAPAKSDSSGTKTESSAPTPAPTKTPTKTGSK